MDRFDNVDITNPYAINPCEELTPEEMAGGYETEVDITDPNAWNPYEL